MSIGFQEVGTQNKYKIKLAHPCALDLQLPMSETHGARTVTVDGVPVRWELLPGFGRSLVKIDLPSAASAEVEISGQDALKTYPAVSISGNTGEAITLGAEDAT